MCPCDQCFPRGNVTCHDTCRPDTVTCPLYKDDKIIQQPAVLTELDNLYTSQAVKFIEVQSSGTDKPEFVMGCFRKFLIPMENVEWVFTDRYIIFHVKLVLLLF